MKALWAAALLAAVPARAEHAQDGGQEAVVSAARGEFLYSAEPFAFGVNGQVVLRRVSHEGGLVWNETFGRNQGEEASAVGVTADGGAVLAGARRRGCFVARWDATGRRAWDVAPESFAQCRPAAVLTDNVGSAYVLATVSNAAGGFDVVVLAFDAKGEQRWRWRYPSSDTVYARNLTLDPRGDRLRGYVLRRVGTEFVEEFFRLDLDGRRLDR